MKTIVYEYRDNMHCVVVDGSVVKIFTTKEEAEQYIAIVRRMAGI